MLKFIKQGSLLLKNSSIVVLLLSVNMDLDAQVWTNNGSVINILPGTEIKSNNLENNSGTITNNGNITLTYNYTNLATVNGNGNYYVAGDWSNPGTFTEGTGVVTFNGTTAQSISQTNSFNNVTLNKASGAAVLLSNVSINGVLHFVLGNVQTGSNKITVSSSGSITGAGQTTGWVYGNLQKNIPTGSNTYAFETGDNTNYTPAVIAFNGVTTGGNLAMNTTSPDHANINTSAIYETKSVNRYYTFLNNGIVFTDAITTFNWVAADVDAGAVTANFKVGRYNGTTWAYPMINAPAPTSIQATGITSFGDFIIGEMNAALPVSLTNIKASLKNQGVQVEWVTHWESNLDRYEIERSANGQSFTKVGTVKAKGNSNLVLQYNWPDNNPLSGVNYYRIRSVGTGTDISYSAVVKVNMNIGKPQIIFYPNPVIGNTIMLQLNNTEKGNYTVSLTNTIGQQVFKKYIVHTGGSAVQTIPVNALPAGIYQLQITGGGIKFIKQVLKSK